MGGDPINFKDPFGLCDKDNPCSTMKKIAEWAETQAKGSKANAAVKAYGLLEKASKWVDAIKIGKAGKETGDHEKVANRMVARMKELGKDTETNAGAIEDDTRVYQHEYFKAAQSATKGAEVGMKAEYGWPWWAP